jgi:hypothetical protein
MSIRKPDALTGQSVNIWRLNYFSLVTADITITKIIRQNYNDIGSLSLIIV